MSCHAAQELDHHGAGHGVLHDLDPLAKLLATVVFVVTVVSFPKYAVGELVPFCLFPALLLVGGRVPAEPFFRLLRLGLPLALLAGVWNIFLDPARVQLPGGLAVSAGWFSFLSILLRYGLTAGAVLALVGTTSFPRLMHGLARLRLPHVFIQLLFLLYRHLFVLVEEGRALAHAWQLRCPQRRLPDLPAVGPMVGGLFLRSEVRGGRLYRAMVLRGYDGTLPFRREHGFRAGEWALLLLTLAGCVAGRFLPLTAWLGGAWMSVFN